MNRDNDSFPRHPLALDGSEEMNLLCYLLMEGIHVRDIDFSRWYDSITIIGNSYWSEEWVKAYGDCPTFLLRFTGVSEFSLSLNPQPVIESGSSSELLYFRGLRDFRIERNENKKKYYLLKTREEGIYDSSFNVRFKSFTIKNLDEWLDRFEEGNGFFSPRAKENVYRHFNLGNYE